MVFSRPLTAVLLLFGLLSSLSAGTPVTVETFAAWKEKFTVEMQSTKKVSLKDEATAKLTGTLQPQRSHSLRVFSLDCMHKSDTLQPTDIVCGSMRAGRQLWQTGLVTEEDEGEADHEVECDETATADATADDNNSEDGADHDGASA